MKHNHLNCEAPICPFTPDWKENLDTWVWYPDEVICKGVNKSPEGKRLVRVQRRIQKRFNNGKIDNRRYFSSRMLLKIRSVRAGIKGENPNRRHNPTTGMPVEGSNPLESR